MELDGRSHIGRADYDLDRQTRIGGEGYRVIRFHNDEVLSDAESIVRAILKACGRNPFTGERLPLPSGPM